MRVTSKTSPFFSVLYIDEVDTVTTKTNLEIVKHIIILKSNGSIQLQINFFITASISFQVNCVKLCCCTNVTIYSIFLNATALSTIPN